MGNYRQKMVTQIEKNGNLNMGRDPNLENGESEY